MSLLWDARFKWVNLECFFELVELSLIIVLFIFVQKRSWSCYWYRPRRFLTVTLFRVGIIELIERLTLNLH